MMLENRSNLQYFGQLITEKRCFKIIWINTCRWFALTTEKYIKWEECRKSRKKAVKKEETDFYECRRTCFRNSKKNILELQSVPHLKIYI